MIFIGTVKRGRKCAAKDCPTVIEPGLCIEDHVGSGKWHRVKSYCRHHGVAVLNKEKEKLHKIEIAVYGEDGA